MDGATLVGVVVALVLQTLLGALAIWIVGKLNVGLTVSGFGGAILVAYNTASSAIRPCASRSIVI